MFLTGAGDFIRGFCEKHAVWEIPGNRHEVSKSKKGRVKLQHPNKTLRVLSG